MVIGFPYFANQDFKTECKLDPSTVVIYFFNCPETVQLTKKVSSKLGKCTITIFTPLFNYVQYYARVIVRLCHFHLILCLKARLGAYLKSWATSRATLGLALALPKNTRQGHLTYFPVMWVTQRKKCSKRLF